MPDRNKVIKGLEICKPSKYSRTCGICPYREEMNCDYEVYNDALALLKEQEAVEPFSDDDGGYWCSSCHEDIVWNQKFCSNCGRPVLWKGR